MSTIFASHNPEMDLAAPEDRMEIGTSPYPQADDIDLDFGHDRHPSVDRSMEDDPESAVNETDLMQDDVDDMYDNDEILGDDALEPTNQNAADPDDLNMNSYTDEPDHDQDEEILYDEEEFGSVDMTASKIDDPTTDYVPQQEYDIATSAEHNSELQPDDTNGRRKDMVESTLAHSNHDLSQSTPTADQLNSHTADHDSLVAETDVVDFATQKTLEPTQEQSNVALQANQEQQQSHQAGRSSAIEDTVPPSTMNDAAPATETSATENDLHLDGAVLENTDVHDQPHELTAESSDSTSPLHPITVLYMGQEMSLFPPMIEDSSATFFLSESGLAYGSMEKLLASCRDVLGESLEHDDELVLDIPALGLHICEDSKYASEITLSQVVDVYLTLTRNESIQEIEPLFCSLSSRVCLASQYAYLTASAAEGKTYSEIAAEHVDSPDHDAVSFHQSDGGEHSNDVDEPTQTMSGDVEEDLATENLQQDQANEYADEDNLDQSVDRGAVTEHVSSETDATVDLLDEPDRQVDESPNPQSEIQTKSLPQSSTDLEYANTEESAALAPVQDEHLKDTEHDIADDHDSRSSHTVEGEDVESAEPLADAVGGVDDYDESGQHGDQQDETDVANQQLQQEADREQDAINHEAPHDNSWNDLEVDNGEISNTDANNTVDNHLQNDDYKEDDDANEDYETLEFDEVDTEDEYQQDTNNNAGEIDVTLQVENPAIDAPVTPSKANGSKRKALDAEDDLDFLDFSTPEPKRNRSQ